MANQAVEKARDLLRRYPELSFPVNMEDVLGKEGCEVVEWSFASPVREVKRGRWVGMAHGLDQPEARYLMAHALGHHLLHCGNQLWFREWQQASTRRQEREADEFAAHILIPEGDLARVGTLDTWEIAERFGVPEELARRRVIEFATNADRRRWQQED